jgi:protein-L-isoaspartate(D-aspartate) O-methyltransferase
MDWRTAQERMVAEQVVGRGILNARIREAMINVPRHLFVPEEYRDRAYADQALPIGDHQTISQPYMVATMLNVLNLQGTEKVLEVGTGSGYNAALLGRLAREVVSIEIVPELAGQAHQRLRELGLRNVSVEVRDGSLGLPEKAPFDAIVVTAAAPRLPPPLLEQLTLGGQLLIPITRGPGEEVLTQVRRNDQGFDERPLGRCTFVPLVGAFGQGS